MVINMATAAFLLTLVVFFLLVVMFFLLVAIRRQINNVDRCLRPAIPVPKGIAIPQPTPKKQQLAQPEVVERVEEDGMETPEQIIKKTMESAVKAQEKFIEEEKKAEPEEFKCKKCNKTFKDKKKLQRHIGMAHYADLEV